MTANPPNDESCSEPTIDPEALRERDGVPVEHAEQVAPPEAFDGIRANYEASAGVVAVGVVHDGRVLLLDHGAPGPIRGDVRDGESWAAAARRVVAELAGVDVELERAEHVEYTEFRTPDGDERFTVPTVHVRASLPGVPRVADRTRRPGPQVPRRRFGTRPRLVRARPRRRPAGPR